jgi:hypothetical protein
MKVYQVGTILKVGDIVSSHHGESKITRMEIVEDGAKDEGIQVEKIYWSMKDHIVVDLENGHWAMGYTLLEIVSPEQDVELNIDTPVIH